MNKNRLKRIAGSFLVGAIAMSLLTVAYIDSPIVEKAVETVAEPASAAVANGGGSSGGGSSGGVSGASWVRVDSIGQVPHGTANGWNSLDSYLRVMGGIGSGYDTLMDVCYNHTTDVYYLSSPQGWAIVWSGNPPINGALSSASAEVRAAATSNVALICVNRPDVPQYSEWRYSVRDTTSRDSINQNGIHTLITSVTPQPIRNSENQIVTDPVGENNLHEESVSLRTNYGRVWDEYKAATERSNAETSNIVGDFKNRFTRALEMDATAARPQVSLSENNQAGLSEGGILNVQENGNRQRAVVSTTTTNYQVRKCGWIHYSISGWRPSSGNNCTNVTTNGINPNSLPVTPIYGTTTSRWESNDERRKYDPTSPGLSSWNRYATVIQPDRQTPASLGFWQIISAHCNVAGIDALRSAMGSNLTTMNSGDSTRQISGLLRTRVYTPAQMAASGFQIPLGNNHSSLPAAQRATSNVGFFDKECPFECVASPSGSGSSADNTAAKNVGNSNRGNAKEGTLWGANSSDSINSNYFEIFRDNAERTIRPDVWYPANANGVDYRGEAPKSTMLTRIASGTPTVGEEFNIYANVDGEKIALFNNSNTTQINQKNFDGGAVNSAGRTAGQVVGLAEELIVQSTWASEADRPQSINIAWEYSPRVTHAVARTVGFAPGGSNAQVTTVNRTTNIDGRCWAEFGTANQLTRDFAVSDMNRNTGSSVTTNFSTATNNVSDNRNLVLRFVRGTSE